MRLSFAADEGVCGNGRGNISIRREGRTGQVRQADGEWGDECQPGPVRVARDLVLRMRRPEQVAADLDWLYGWRLPRTD